MRRFVTITGFLFLILSGINCSEKTVDPPPIEPPPDIFELTPLPNEQAEHIALWLSDSIAAPLDLYDRIDKELQLIDSLWGDSLEIWDDWAEWGGSLLPDEDDVIFRLRSDPSKVLFDIDFDSLTTHYYNDSVRTPFFRFLDSLNLDSIVYQMSHYHPHHTLYFNGRLNSVAIGERLKEYEEITRVKTWQFGYVGGISMLYPILDDTLSRYYYFFSYGDCPAGCINTNMYCLGAMSDTVVLLETFRTEYDPGLPLHWDSLVLPEIQRWRAGYIDWERP